METKNIDIKHLETNSGQLEGLPKNPRHIRDERFEQLKKSILDAPEMLSIRELVVFPLPKKKDKYIIISGNMRFKACKALGYTVLPCKVLDADTPVEKLREYTIKENESFGENDWSVLGVEWKLNEIVDWGTEIDWDSLKEAVDGKESDPDDDSEDDAADSGDDLIIGGDDGTDGSDDSGDDLDFDKDYEDVMVRDILYPSDNDMEIPTLLIEQQADRVELPMTPWGANSRLTKGVSTYHFYVDDYRFEKLFHDPANLMRSGVKMIVEPNCSLHDQTPIAFGLQLIYKKRWLARYCQDCGIKVFADLNVSHKFIEYNKMGIPKGYNAFATRGLDGWMESLKSDLQVAQEISGLECPNLIVYGGGKEVKEFCKKHNLLYVTDFINAKKL